jgi:hypothetical protein
LAILNILDPPPPPPAKLPATGTAEQPATQGQPAAVAQP